MNTLESQYDIEELTLSPRDRRIADILQLAFELDLEMVRLDTYVERTVGEGSPPRHALIDLPGIMRHPHAQLAALLYEPVAAFVDVQLANDDEWEWMQLSGEKQERILRRLFANAGIPDRFGGTPWERSER